MSTARDRATQLLGQTLGEKYLIERVIGAGGNGAVFEALHVWTDRRVAVKVLPGAQAAGIDACERFLREARALTRVANEGIVEVLDMGRDDARDLLYLVQELLQGEDLFERLRRDGHLSARDAVTLVLPVMRALDAAHEAGVIHRDVKPANIVLARRPDGTVAPKLIDFGVARAAPATQSGEALTITGSPIGTPHYMAPEQARGDAQVDGRADVWGVAVVLYECLCGARPFEASNVNALLFRVALAAPVALRERAPGVPPALAEAIERALEKRPEDRYPSMRAFIAALEPLLDTLPAERGPVRAAPRVTDEPTPVPSDAQPDTLAQPTTALAPAMAAPASISLQSLDAALGRGAEAGALDVDPREVDRASARMRARGWIRGVAVLLLTAGLGALIAARFQSPRPTPVELRSARTWAPLPAPRAPAPALMHLEGAQSRLLDTQIRNVAERVRDDVRRCLGPTWFGAIQVAITVRPDGSVTRASAIGPLATTRRGACVAEVLATLRFPTFRGRSAETVRWRYVYAPTLAPLPDGSR